MKFFWKLFFTTMFISVSCTVLTGYILIQSNLNSLLDNEIITTYEIGDIVYNSLANELKDSNIYYKNSGNLAENIKNISKSIKIINGDDVIRFSILDTNGKTLFSSIGENNIENIYTNLKDNQRGYTISEFKNSIYAETIRPAIFFGDTYYIGTSSNIDYIFKNQMSQYRMLINILIVMFLLASILTFIISKILMIRVKNIIRTSVKITNGKLDKRVSIKGKDEFGILADNFNKMADSLEEKINELKDENERKEMFVGAFSHELKTPLTSIIGYSDMLRSKSNDSHRVSVCANYIFTEGKRLESMSMRLLDLIVLKNQEIYPLNISIDNFLKSIHPIFYQKLQNKDIELTFDLEHAIISFEPELMKTVFVNIIDNALKATEKNGKIQIIGKLEEDKYKVTIKDTGRGMPQEEISKIREAFYMVNKSRARKQGGAGLGLAICDLILKMHGFDISFESEINVGTKVTIIMKGVTSDNEGNN